MGGMPRLGYAEPQPAALPIPGSSASCAPEHAPYLLLHTWLWWFFSDQGPKVTQSYHQVLSGQQSLQSHLLGAQGLPNGRVTAEFAGLLLLFLLVLARRTLQGTSTGQASVGGWGPFIRQQKTPAQPLAHHCNQTKMHNCCCLPSIARGYLVRGLGWKEGPDTLN